MVSHIFIKKFSVLPGDVDDARQGGQDDGQADLRPGVLCQNEVNVDQERMPF